MSIKQDRFKHVNDSLGHDDADQMIVEIARRLACSPSAGGRYGDRADEWVEAMLRWKPQGKAMVAPSDFIPLAEETSLIVIREWVRETAMAQQLAWQRQGLFPVRISVKLSEL